MPTLVELLDSIDHVCRSKRHQLPDDMLYELELALRREYGASRVYIPPLGSRKDPARARRLAAAVRKLPTGIAAAEVGVSASYARRVAKKGKNCKSK